MIPSVATHPQKLASASAQARADILVVDDVLHVLDPFSPGPPEPESLDLGQA